MEKVISILTLLVTAFSWTALYQFSFHKAMPRLQSITLFLTISGTLIMLELQRFSPHFALVICTLNSSVLIWTYGRCKKSFVFVIVQNIAAVLTIKAFYLFVTTITVTVLRLIQGYASRDAVALITLIPLGLFNLLVKRLVGEKDFNSLLHEYSASVITIAGLFFLRSYALIREDGLIDKAFRRYIVITCSVLFLILLFWCINDFGHHKKIKVIQAQIAQMRRDAHRLKELIPAIEMRLVALYSDAQQYDSGSPLSDLQQTIDEVSSLRADYGLETQKESIQAQTFESTGFLLLDSQLQDEQKRALAQDIVFEIIVSKPIDCMVEAGMLSQLAIQRIIGDLFQNSLAAIKRVSGQGTILLTMGYTSAGYQLRISDTGTYFPIEIINSFGIRGITTSSSGNGLADLL